MLVDVLKRYLLIVWNFFFGQISLESIQDGPIDVSTDSSADVVPPVDVDSNDDDDDEIVNEDDGDEDIDEPSFDDDGEEDDEKCDEDENEEVVVDVVVPKAPETKVVTNDDDDVPAAKPSVPVKEIKDPEVLLPTNEVKEDGVKIEKPQLPPVDVEIKDKPKTAASDVAEKKEEETTTTTPTNKSKPELEFAEREGGGVSAAADKVVIAEKDSSKLQQQADFEIVEREGSKDAEKGETPRVGIKEKDVGGKVVAPEEKDTTVKSKQAEVEVKDKESPKPVPDTTKPKDGVLNKTPEKVGGGVHVKFEDDDEVKAAPPAKSPVSTSATLLPDADGGKSAGGDDGKTTSAHNFVVLEKGEVAASKKNADEGLKKPDNAIDSFLSGEQKHSSRVQQQHPESIQDQQLDYSDSGEEELSDDDIEIDYEDDEDEEEVEEVKPLPPVARSVYKKND